MPRRAHVTVVVQGWTGWTREQPPQQSREMMVERGQRLSPETVGIASEGYDISIDAIGPAHVMVTYRGMVMQNDGGTINLAAPKEGRCIIRTQHCMGLSTPTMDGGTSVSVTLNSVEEYE